MTVTGLSSQLLESAQLRELLSGYGVPQLSFRPTVEVGLPLPSCLCAPGEPRPEVNVHGWYSRKYSPSSEPDGCLQVIRSPDGGRAVALWAGCEMESDAVLIATAVEGCEARVASCGGWCSIVHAVWVAGSTAVLIIEDDPLRYEEGWGAKEETTEDRHDPNRRRLRVVAFDAHAGERCEWVSEEEVLSSTFAASQELHARPLAHPDARKVPQ